MNKHFLFLLLLGVCCSCTVQKRVHNRGYFIQWNKHYSSQPASKEINSTNENKPPELVDSPQIEELKKRGHSQDIELLAPDPVLPEDSALMESIIQSNEIPLLTTIRTSRFFQKDMLKADKLKSLQSREKPNFLELLFIFLMSGMLISLFLLILFLVLAIRTGGPWSIALYFLSVCFLIIFVLFFFATLDTYFD